MCTQFSEFNEGELLPTLYTSSAETDAHLVTC